MDAKELEEETTVVIVKDNKRHARASIQKKWQQRWDIGDFDRDFYLCTQILDGNPRLDFPNTRMFKHTLQLRNGYIMLNDCRHKLGQRESGLCECGQMETVQLYLLQCQHQMFTPYLGMMDIERYPPGENRSCRK